MSSAGVFEAKSANDRASVLVTPLLTFFGVVAFAVAVSAPVWLLVRRHAARERIPDAIVVEE